MLLKGFCSARSGAVVVHAMWVSRPVGEADQPSKAAPQVGAAG
jgi:hypothetical protein